MTTHSLVTPFLDDSNAYAYGVEFGMLSVRMLTEDAISGYFLVANREQITLHANRTGWTIDVMKPHDRSFFWMEMRKNATAE